MQTSNTSLHQSPERKNQLRELEEALRDLFQPFHLARRAMRDASFVQIEDDFLKGSLALTYASVPILVDGAILYGIYQATQAAAKYLF